jgi:hypothetical protein
MPSLINRTTKYKSMTIANGAALSDAFDMRDYAGGNLYMPAAWTAANRHQFRRNLYPPL